MNDYQECGALHFLVLLQTWVAAQLQVWVSAQVRTRKPCPVVNLLRRDCLGLAPEVPCGPWLGGLGLGLAEPEVLFPLARRVEGRGKSTSWVE